ncbi:MAG: penicillin-binding protein activator [Oleibacter sp.]|nr:penicillin-binding protein activator [Thalassolituus sp.]
MQDYSPEVGSSMRRTRNFGRFYLNHFLSNTALSRITVMCLLGLTACAPLDNTSKNSGQWTSTPQTSFLRAARSQLDAGEFGNANAQLQQMSPSKLSGYDLAEFHLLSANVSIETLDAISAEDHLRDFNRVPSGVTQGQKLRSKLLSIRVLELQRRYLNAARERDFISETLTGKDNQDNYEMLWSDLSLLSEESLRTASSKTPATRFGAWLRLAAISRNNELTLDEQIAAIEQWRQANPYHPAALDLPDSLAVLQQAVANRPKNITLLLPLSGRLERTGQAIRDGFMAAYYDAHSKGYPVPAVSFLDSQTVPSMDDAYLQAQSHNSEWLVGPITKSDVVTLENRTTLPLPTLALNYSDTINPNKPSNLFQFGLSAEDEAEQVAEQAWLDGRRNAMVMAPDGDWGHRVVNAFEDKWLSMGGEISKIHYYQRARDYNPDVRTLLGIQGKTDDHLLLNPDGSEWLFLVSLPPQARQIKPTLAYNLAGELPVYSTSQVYAGQPSPGKDYDLNGILFCDAPWVLHESDLKTNIEASIPENQASFTRLYAMGVDAFKLVMRMGQFTVLDNAQIYGETGVLTVNNRGIVHRRTECAVFQKGVPVLRESLSEDSPFKTQTGTLNEVIPEVIETESPETTSLRYKETPQ